MQQGRPRELVSAPADPFVTRFVEAQRRFEPERREDREAARWRGVAASLLALASLAAPAARRRAAPAARGQQVVHRVGDPGRDRQPCWRRPPAPASSTGASWAAPGCCGRRCCAGDVDVYPEYTGTLLRGDPGRQRPPAGADPVAWLRAALRDRGAGRDRAARLQQHLRAGHARRRRRAAGRPAHLRPARAPGAALRLLQRVHEPPRRLAGPARPLPAAPAGRARPGARPGLPGAGERQPGRHRSVRHRRRDPRTTGCACWRTTATTSPTTRRCCSTGWTPGPARPAAVRGAATAGRGHRRAAR